MRWVDANEVQWQRFSGHRQGFAQNKRLLSGREGAPDNFELSIVEVDGAYGTPRHHHNFDQIRFMLDGRFGVGPETVLEEGTISYFPEAAHYIQRGIGTSRTLLLQFGGASGNGFMSYAQLERGQHELSKTGEFAGGNYLWTAEDGTRCTKDAYEAIWEQINGRPLTYPAERYTAPVVTTPDHFSWVPLPGAPGVAVKSCGRFSERDIGMGFLRVDVGASLTVAENRIYYLLHGGGRCRDIDWGPGVAVDPDGKDASFTASLPTEFVYFDRPTFPPA